jgi:hypothetical protein
VFLDLIDLDNFASPFTAGCKDSETKLVHGVSIVIAKLLPRTIIIRIMLGGGWLFTHCLFPNIRIEHSPHRNKVNPPPVLASPAPLESAAIANTSSRVLLAFPPIAASTNCALQLSTDCGAGDDMQRAERRARSAPLIQHPQFNFSNRKMLCVWWAVALLVLDGQWAPTAADDSSNNTVCLESDKGEGCAVLQLLRAGLVSVHVGENEKFVL